MTDSPPPRPRTPVCGIGASAGGVEALQELFTTLPADIGLAYVVIVHLAPDHKSELPATLRRWTAMPVVQVADHDRIPIVPNHVYVIAPDRKLEITDSMIGASPFEQPLGRRNAIDLFFRSLALEHGDGFAIVLSGAGSDGALGAKAVKESGGLVLVQDPTEAAHGDMPRAVIATGAADLVLPLSELARRLPELARVKDRLKGLEQRVAITPERSDPLPSEEEKSLKGVLDVLRKRTGNDFSRYKRTTILRRLSRRMQLVHQITIGEYLKYLRIHPAEVTALLDDLLISVTTFFRDPEAWAALAAEVIGPLIGRDGEDPIRTWVAGCSTGEEAYTLAILLDEECARRGKESNFLVFATDLDESSLAVARAGVYPRAISTDVSEARLAHYFVQEDDYYRVATKLRDRVVFASHSVLRDPPFSRLHLISCRNLLIYLDRDLQEQLMGIFRYACREDGFLLLGISETATEDLFVAIDRKQRIFGPRRRPDGTRPQLPDMLTASSGRLVRHGREFPTTTKFSPAEIHFAALEEVAPPSVVIDERGHVLHLSATVARFLQQGAGTPARRLIDLVRPALRDELHALLQRAFDTPAPQLSPFVPVPFNGGAHRVAMLAQRRVRGDRDDGREDVLVTFLDAGPARTEVVTTTDQEPSGELVRTLRDKLREAEQRIDNVRDEQHLTHEDLRAANEELQSLNEEYRSTTEELETSKEELQSINEELQTLNLELKVKLEEVSRAHNDLENLMSATNVATLFLNTELRIKRFTPQLGDLFNIRSRDLDRPIGDLTHSLEYTSLALDARAVLTSFVPIEQETTSRSGRTYIVRLHPYRTLGGRDIDGVVITFIDVTALKQAEAALRESERKLDVELRVMRRLHHMTLVVATTPSMTEALDEILSAAIDLHQADLGNLQLADDDAHLLRIVAQRGFRPSFLDEFGTVDGRVDDTACGRALRTHELIQIPDVQLDAAYAPYRRAAADAGYRAVQSMPLIDTAGTLMGVLSVHFRAPHVFGERDRQFADLLGQQAADLIASRAQQDRLRDLNHALLQRTQDLEGSQEQLSRQAADLVQQDRNRQEFLAALGHELRNPMAAMFSSLSLVSVSDDRSRRALAVLRRQTTHMTRLINDLLDITRVKHGRLQLDRVPVDVNVCMLAAVETARPQADTKGLALECALSAEPLYVDADPERLAQILDNLLRNAIACTEAGSITLAVARTPPMAQFSVQDTGIGLNAEDLSWIFEPYHQRRESTRNVGLGLGLTLVKGLVEAHGGTVRVQSDGRGKGAEFTFTIPLALAVPALAATDVPAGSQTLRILVVDDQQDVANMLGGLLETLGQDVQIAYSGSAALIAARSHRPEVAFLDIAMPEMSGPELARRLRAEFPSDGLALIALTGHDKQYTQETDGLFDHHLLKPANPETLATLLNDLIARR